MKYIPVFTAVLLSILLLGACATTGASSPSPTMAAGTASAAATTGAVAAPKITPADAKKRLDSEQGIIVLDVRTAEEYAAGHIKGSINFPLETIATDAAAKLTDKNAVIFTYCRTGIRSAAAASHLVQMGYTQVFDLGGIVNWPYEVVTN